LRALVQASRLFCKALYSIVFGHEADELAGQVGLPHQPRARGADAGAPGRLVQRRQRLGRGARPGAVKGAQPRRRLQPVQPGRQLGVVRAVVLRVDLPDQGPAGPQGAHQRVLAAHEVEVAGPQQPVVGPLIQMASMKSIADRAVLCRMQAV
jgi:hypothetical protein